MTEKQGLFIKLDERDKPIAILYRTKEGYWVWHKIEEMDEDEQIRLIQHEERTIKTKTTEIFED